jgi:hypothetical protein
MAAVFSGFPLKFTPCLIRGGNDRHKKKRWGNLIFLKITGGEYEGES